MKIIKNLTFAALAVTLLFQTSRALADNSAPVRLTFEKTFAGAGPAPYVSHFLGSFGGDFAGTLYTGLLVRQAIDELGQVVHLEADYMFIADDGIHSFIAHVEGNSVYGKAVLNGIVTDGYLEGAQVQIQFDVVLLPARHFEGTVRIMPASAD